MDKEQHDEIKKLLGDKIKDMASAISTESNFGLSVASMVGQTIDNYVKFCKCITPDEDK